MLAGGGASVVGGGSGWVDGAGASVVDGAATARLAPSTLLEADAWMTPATNMPPVSSAARIADASNPRPSMERGPPGSDPPTNARHSRRTRRRSISAEV